METSFNLRYKADMRAIKRWQEATGEELTWPDHADLCVWLLERGNFNDGIEAAAKMADQHGCNTSNVLCQALADAIRALKKE